MPDQCMGNHSLQPAPGFLPFTRLVLDPFLLPSASSSSHQVRTRAPDSSKKAENGVYVLSDSTPRSSNPNSPLSSTTCRPRVGNTFVSKGLIDEPHRNADLLQVRCRNLVATDGAGPSCNLHMSYYMIHTHHRRMLMRPASLIDTGWSVQRLQHPHSSLGGQLRQPHHDGFARQGRNGQGSSCCGAATATTSAQEAQPHQQGAWLSSAATFIHLPSFQVV